MKRTFIKSVLGAGASIATIALLVPSASYAQSPDDTITDEIITIGTRRANRSAADTPAPIDVISVNEFTRSASTDVQNLLRTSVPSFNVNSQSTNDGGTLIRPANLRGLSPDQTLVLVNGKRRHRGAIIAFFGGGIADGAQGVDISAIPTLALKQVEVLRDGAASQYGSDAIAGVLNFSLNDSAEGGTIEAQYGETYTGDGEEFKIGANYGFALGDAGFVNLTAEYSETNATIRGTNSAEVERLLSNGVITEDDFLEITNGFTDELAQFRGRPNIDDDLKLFYNTAFEIGDNAEIYSFGGVSTRETQGGFFFRSPGNQGSVFRGPEVDPDTGLASEAPNAVDSILVADLGIAGGDTCPDGIPLLNGQDSQSNATFQNFVNNSENCFAFNEPGLFPLGFTPVFGGDTRDFSLTGGIRGELGFGNGLNYDISVTHGQSEVDFTIVNTVNASLGPNTPTEFDPGAQEQIETSVDVDFSYSLPVAALASDLNIAFGGQYREETFEITEGDAGSTAVGPLAAQGFATGSNGFSGFIADSSNSQDSFAIYTDLEADVTEQLTLQGALRYEDLGDFGDTVDYKVAGLYRVNDAFRVRGTYSTGFRAPTAGQVNIPDVTTDVDPVTNAIINTLTVPLNGAVGQILNNFVELDGNGPLTLGPENSRSFTVGAAFDLGPTSWTIDYYNIDVEDRIAPSANIDFLDALNAINGDSFTSVISALDTLGAAGTINRNDFAGFETVTEAQAFSNSFGTRTQGVDLVGRYAFDFLGGDSSLVLLANYNDTNVTDVSAVNPISQARIDELEVQLPNVRGNLSWNHNWDKWRVLTRVNYFGPWTDADSDQDIGSEFLFDAEVAYQVTEGLEILAGVNNIFDNFPDENQSFSGGELYHDSSPTGLAGGQYYVRARYSF